MSARLSLAEKPQIAWKGKTFSQITATLRRNGLFDSTTDEITPKLALKARPIKLYRKEIASVAQNTCNPRRSVQVFDFDTPGNNIVNSNIPDVNADGIANTIDPTLPNIRGEYPGSACDSCFSNTNLESRYLSAENNARRRVRSSGIIKRAFTTNTNINNLKYYTNTNQYLDSRNKTFQQNEYHFLRKGDTTSIPGTAAATDNVYASHTVAHCVSADGSPLVSAYVPVYYKPSNSKFAQQGGVSGSSQIQRKKYDTITDAGSKLQTTFGKETASALAYSTTDSSIYSLKQKVGYPNKQTPTFSKVTGELVCNGCKSISTSVIPNIQILSILGKNIKIAYTDETDKTLSYIVSLSDNNGNMSRQLFETVPEYVIFEDLDVFTDYILTIIFIYVDKKYTYEYPIYIQTLNEGPVTNIYYKNVSNTSVDISFTESPGVNKTYNIIYQGTGQNSNTITGITGTELSLTDLSINTLYSVTVTTLYTSSNNNSYSYSESNLFQTLNEGPVANIYYKNVSNTTVDISFTESPGEIQSYTVNYTDQNNNSNTTSGITDTNLSLTNLSINTIYSITVISVYTNNTYSYSKPNLFQTLNEGPITDISYNTLLNTSATISFTESPGVNKTYTIIYQGTGQNSNTITGITGTEFSLTNLSINTIYSITVISVYANNTYSYSKSNLFQTLNERPTTDITYNTLLNTSAIIYFTESPGAIQSYTVKYTDPDNITNTTTGITATSLALSNLSINTTYSITVISVYANNNYTYSKTNLFQTLNEGPTTDISYSSLSNTSATISFPASPGVNKTYTVKYTDPENITNTTTGITATSLALSNLSINTTYSVTVITVYTDNNNNYTYSKTNLFQTLNEGPTTDISYNTLLNTSVDISFTESPGEIQSYTVNYTDQNNNSNTTTGITGTELSLTNLSINTIYSITVISVYTNNTYSYSKSNLFQTLNEGPSTISSVTGGSTTITFTFSNPYNIPNVYSVYASRVTDSTIATGDLISGTANATETFILDNLTTDMSYNVYIITKYTSNILNVEFNEYTTEWPNQIYIGNSGTTDGNSGTGPDGDTNNGDTGPTP